MGFSVAPSLHSLASMPPTFTIVVPVYNEATFVSRALPEMVAEVEAVGAEYVILIVENGSTDGTTGAATAAAHGLPVTVHGLPDADYGAALRHGFLAADSEWVVNFDIDYFSGGFLRQVLEAGETADLVIGSKRFPGSEDRRPLLRRLATRVFNLLLRFVLDSRVSDTHGMKAFRSDLVATLAPEVVATQDLFDTELVLRAERAGYRIVEVPVVVEEIRRARSSLLKRVPRTLLGIFRLRRILRS